MHKDDLVNDIGYQDSGRHQVSTLEGIINKDTVVSDAPWSQEHLPPPSPPSMVGVKVSACRDKRALEVSGPVGDKTRAGYSGGQRGSNDGESAITIVENMKRDITVRGVSLEKIMMKKKVKEDKKTPSRGKKTLTDQKMVTPTTPSINKITNYLSKKKTGSGDTGTGVVMEDKKTVETAQKITRSVEDKKTPDTIVKKALKKFETKETKLTFITPARKHML